MQCIYESKRKNIGKGVSIPYRVHAIIIKDLDDVIPLWTQVSIPYRVHAI